MFKAGDIVRCIVDYGKSQPSGFKKGNLYFVKDYLPTMGMIMIEFDDNLSTKNGWDEKCFELVTFVPEVNSGSVEIPTLVVVHNRDCECGAWAVKDYLHSTWCRMYKEN